MQKTIYNLHPQGDRINLTLNKRVETRTDKIQNWNNALKKAQALGDYSSRLP